MPHGKNNPRKICMGDGGRSIKQRKKGPLQNSHFATAPERPAGAFDYTFESLPQNAKKAIPNGMAFWHAIRDSNP